MVLVSLQIWILVLKYKAYISEVKMLKVKIELKFWPSMMIYHGAEGHSGSLHCFNYVHLKVDYICSNI
jgi:hypothetical protein